MKNRYLAIWPFLKHLTTLLQHKHSKIKIYRLWSENVFFKILVDRVCVTDRKKCSAKKGDSQNTAKFGFSILKNETFQKENVLLFFVNLSTRKLTWYRKKTKVLEKMENFIQTFRMFLSQLGKEHKSQHINPLFKFLRQHSRNRDSSVWSELLKFFESREKSVGVEISVFSKKCHTWEEKQSTAKRWPRWKSLPDRPCTRADMAFDFNHSRKIFVRLQKKVIPLLNFSSAASCERCSKQTTHGPENNWEANLEMKEYLPICHQLTYWIWQSFRFMFRHFAVKRFNFLQRKNRSFQIYIPYFHWQ